jgi:hypothetical protein
MKKVIGFTTIVGRLHTIEIECDEVTVEDAGKNIGDVD